MVNPSHLSGKHIGLVSQNLQLIEQLHLLDIDIDVIETPSAQHGVSYDVVIVDDEANYTQHISSDIPHVLLVDLSKTDLVTVLSSGYADYIPKPIQLATVEHRLSTLIMSNQQTEDPSQEDYRTILSSMSEPVFVFDHEGRYVRIPYNQTENYYEPPDKMLGQTIHNQFPEALADRLVATIQTAIGTQTQQTVEYELSLKDRRTYFSAVVSPIKGRDEVVWVARDVTRNKLNELALIETEKGYQQLFDHANDMILIVDQQTGRILSANEQAQKQLGYTREELHRLNINQIEVSAEGPQSHIVNRTLTTKGYIVVEQMYRRKDGTQIPVETSTRLTNRQNRLILLSFSRNIRQRKIAMQAEADERYFAEALRDSIAQLAHAHTMSDVLDVMLSTVVKVIDSESSNIMLVEGDTAQIVRTHGYVEPNYPETLPIPKTFTLQYMRETQQAMIISNVDHDPRWVKIGNDKWMKSYIGAPIRLNDEVIGYINLDSKTINHFTNKHRQRLQAFADQSAIAIQNARLYEANRQYTEDLEARVRERTLDLTRANEKLLHQIDKRIQAEESLSEERNLLRTIINSLPDTIYVKNRYSQYTLANRFPHPAIHEQPYLGKTDLDILENKTLAQKHYEEEQHLMETGDVHIAEDYTITPDGDEQWFIRTKVPFRDEHDEIIGLVCVNQDVTQIKMAERQLRQLLSNAQCLLWYAAVELDEGQYQWQTTVENEDTASKFLPFDTSTTDYTTAWLNSIPSDIQSLRDTVARTHLKYEQSNYTFEYRCMTSDGKTHWLNEDVQIQKITDNRWHLVGVSLDISDLKSAEIALRQSRDEMEQHVIERTTELSHANKELQREILIRQEAESSERQQRLLAEALINSITAMNTTLDIEGVLDKILDGIQHVVDHTASNIMLMHGTQLATVRQRGYAYTIPDFAIDTFKDFEIVLETRQPYIVKDTATDKYWGYWEESEWIRSNVKLPIVYADTILGIINLDSDTPDNFKPEHVVALQAFANQASIALNNANLYQQAQNEIVERKRAENAERTQRQFSETLRETAILLNQQLNTEDLFNTVLTAIEKIISVHDTSSMMLLDHDTMTGVVVTDRGFEQFGGSVKGVEVDFSFSHTKQHLIDQRIPIFISDTRVPNDLWIEVEETKWIRSHLSVPIYVKDKVLALINLDSKTPNMFTQTHIDQLVIFSLQVAIAVENAQLIEQIQKYAQQLESRVAQRTKELELERSQLRAILDAMRDGVYYTDTDYKPLYINNALTQITGYSTDMWLSSEVFDHINNRPDLDRKKLWQGVEQYLRSNQFWQQDVILNRADGTTFDASLTRTQVVGYDGQLEGIVTVVRDISLQKQLESQKARFIANAAHELRTPITNVKTRLFLMKHQQERFREHLNIAESAINWMQTLVDNLFEHSRFERGIIQLDVEQIILQDFLNIIVVTQQAEASRKHINIIPDWDKDLIRINVDKSRLRQVITNLINNALHYTQENGSITVGIRKALQDSIPVVLINVKDTGSGIDKSHLPHLFQPFYRATDDGKGAGLGLSISREIIEAHKGTIRVESEPGKGTTFLITLPILTKQQLLGET